MPRALLSNRLPVATYTSQPRIGLRPLSRQASWKWTAPNMLPWSVMASDFIPNRAACSTSSSMWHAPSRRLYSVCRWRWANSGFTSLPLDGGGRLAGDVVDHAVDPLHLVDDPVAHAGEQVVGQARPVRGHAVERLHRAQRDRVL